ncbi:YgfZ/GcvT domain-containing protein [Pararoseomonas indoligenes]|uniref:Folate-binding protein YgfZ n=1 Tax=Roseomonas indoligenes TaxID=2820811 RepID=A0A940S5V4_9PROT|nr:folate-binding protein YgfZ [Pararoseomonas indoligenes]MBP0491397.1 folate-binding protein YgfZ [Pararoseomonas indoligenes]
MPATPLPDRGLVAVSGPDRETFLQGLVSNDVTGLGTGMRWAALLSPQGKWTTDFLMFEAPGIAGDAILLDLPRADAAMVVERLSRFRLRSKVTLSDRTGDMPVGAVWAEEPPMAALARRDPRLEAAGWRTYGTALEGDPAAYDRHRLALGLPDGTRDLDRDKTVLLEAGFDELGGIAWDKGCYMGQELTARTRYRGLLKRRLVPVAVEGPLPPRDAPVTLDGGVVGDMRSGAEGLGLALLRLEAARAPALACGEAVLRPMVPEWMRLPAPA